MIEQFIPTQIYIQHTFLDYGYLLNPTSFGSKPIICDFPSFVLNSGDQIYFHMQIKLSKRPGPYYCCMLDRHCFKIHEVFNFITIMIKRKIRVNRNNPNSVPYSMPRNGSICYNESVECHSEEQTTPLLSYDHSTSRNFIYMQRVCFIKDDEQCTHKQKIKWFFQISLCPSVQKVNSHIKNPFYFMLREQSMVYTSGQAITQFPSHIIHIFPLLLNYNK